jgi:ATP-dependent DNA ligase
MAITAAKKAPNPTDRHIGSRVRMRRKMLAMSQTQLADALGITYQQVRLEGIVSKRKGSLYRSGRSPDWLKMKNANAPAVKREEEEEWGKK